MSPRVFISTAIAACFCLPAISRGDEIPAFFKQRVDFDKAIESPFKDVVEFLGRKFGWKLEVDYKAFESEGLKNPKDARIRLPKMPNYFPDTILRLVASQAGGVYEIRDGTAVIVPNQSQGKPRSFPPLTDEQKKAQKELRDYVSKKQIVLNTADLEAPLKDLMEFVADRCGLTIMFDSRRLPKFAEETRGKIEKGSHTFDEVMKQALKPIKATYVIEPDHIRIVPQEES
jgi:hypothetical protein